MMASYKEKKVLRKSLLDKRLDLAYEIVQEYSEKILNLLSIYVDWSKIETLNVYSPIEENNEVNTLGLIAYLGKNYPGMKIDIAPMKPGSSVPVGKSYDLIIVPMLGFDRRGYRLGYGGGYYDKLLARNNFKKIIGLAYSFSEIEKVPDETHDQKVQVIITEKQIIRPN